MSCKPTRSRQDKKRKLARHREQQRQRDAQVRAELAHWERDRSRFEPLFATMIAKPGLTTPATIDAVVRDFCASISAETPRFLACEPEPWSRQSMCTMNVREYIRLHAGHVVCGYRIWYNGRDYIEAERHAVWSDGGVLRDVSFSADGEIKTLFLPDAPERQHDFEASPERVQHAIGAAQRSALAWYQRGWKHLSAKLHRNSQEEGWAVMPTYEQWLASTRASNFGWKEA